MIAISRWVNTDIRPEKIEWTGTAKETAFLALESREGWQGTLEIVVFLDDKQMQPLLKIEGETGVLREILSY